MRKVYPSMSSSEADRSEQLFREHRAKLYRYVLKFVPAADAEDLVQQTFLQAHAYQKSGNEIRSPLQFLYKTARNLVGMNHRHKKIAATEPVADTDALGLEPEAPSLERQVMSEKDFEAFVVAIARLPPQCRKAFVFKKVYGYTCREIAERLGIAVNTVRVHVAKGFKLCKAYRQEKAGT